MKVVILAGGYGTRISEESAIRPKPLVEIGGQPILWHIMKIYSAYGLNDFVVCCGYKGHLIKQYFRDYALGRSDLTFDLHDNTVHSHRNGVEPWRVTLLDTGEKTMTGGRIKRARPYLDEQPFCLTYGDGVSDINIAELIDFHHRNGALVTVSAVRPPSSSTRRPSTTSTAMTRCGSASPWRTWSAKDALRRSDIAASGRTWTRCATRPCSRTIGKVGDLNGRTGDVGAAVGR